MTIAQTSMPTSDLLDSDRYFRMATFQATGVRRSFVRQRRESGARTERRASRLETGILDEYYFLHLLRLERKRTERSRKPFVLMLLDSGNVLNTWEQDETLLQVFSALEICTRETDTLGWYRHDKTLGVIFTEIGEDKSASATVIATKATERLQQALPEYVFKGLNITFRVFPEDDHPRSEADFTFYPDFTNRHSGRAGAEAAKRAIDIAISLSVILLLSPLFAVLAALVKLTSKGPILFRQKRVGQYGVSFTFLKFRSMFANNDSKIHQEYVAKLIAGGKDLKQKSAEGSVFKLTSDPRITPLGRFLRKSSLDELPQLFNVLSGEMSLVGPRPPVPYEFERYDVWHKRRVLEVKPGITGLWQVHGRSKTTFDEMVRLDLKYAKVWSVWLDLKILLQTPRAVLSGEGAY